MKKKGFVTNSSSSSFILAKKEGFTEEQKKKIMEYVERNMFGKKIASNEKELLNWMQESYYYDDILDEDGKIDADSSGYEFYKNAMEAISKGLTIYGGNVSFECGEEELAYLYENLWEILEDDKDFIGIDTSLDY